MSELNFLGCLQGKKEAIINNNNNNDFQNALGGALNYQTVEIHPERISKLKSYINKYNLERINFPAGSKEWKKFERSNTTIALNILYAKSTKKTNIVYKSKYNNKRKKQLILLMICDGKKYHYLAVTNLCALLQKMS